jgi:ABC-type transporter Mla subunit MlaD
MNHNQYVGRHEAMKVPFLIFLALFLSFPMTGCGNRPKPGYQLHARFGNSQKLKIGDPVLMAGIQIGQVESIGPDPHSPGLRITMELNRSVTVKLDSVATIISISSSQKAIALAGGSSRAERAIHGASLNTPDTISEQQKKSTTPMATQP